MPCIWSDLQFISNDTSHITGWVKGRVQGCENSQVAITFPGVSTETVITTTDANGRFRTQVKLQVLGVYCDQPTNVRFECLDDSSCFWENDITLECGCEVPTIEGNPLGYGWLNEAQFHGFKHLSIGGAEAPGCNLNGEYKFRVNLNGLDADITWAIDYNDDSPETPLTSFNGQSEIIYNLNLNTAIDVIIKAYISPKGDDAQCPFMSLDLVLTGCGDVSCEDYGFFDCPDGDDCCPCPPGEHYNRLFKVCCPDGTSWEPREGICKSDNDPAACQPGTVYDPSTGNCEEAGGTCPPGTIYDPVTRRCQTDTRCPSGTTWNPITKECEENNDRGGRFNLCCGLITAFIAGFVLGWIFAYFGYWYPAAVASWAVAGASLILWSLLCCKKCMRRPYKCCDFIKWNIVAHSITLLILGLIAGGSALLDDAASVISFLCTELPAICSTVQAVAGVGGGNPWVWFILTSALAFWEFLLFKYNCGNRPLPLERRTWPGCRCK